MLGAYVLGDVVATHGLIVTYRAEHQELGRSVLLKTLKPAVAIGSPFAQELEREARVLAMLSHDAILTMLELVRTPQAIALVFEDPGGPRLSEILAKAKRLDPAVVLAIGAEIARGLGHAHARGVVHRDVRPERVFIAPTGAVKVADFGGAHVARLPSLPEAMEAGTFGPPDYVSPEVLIGEGARPCSDVFSLGVVLFEMLAGVRPFAGPDAKDVARRVRTAAPVPFGEVTVPPALERVVMRCLAKEPDDRYADGDEVAAALDAVIAEQAQPPGRVLVSRALAASGLGVELPSSGVGAPRPRAAPATIAKPARLLLLIGALVVAGSAAIEIIARSDEEPPAGSAVEGPATAAQGRGFLRVLAKPWADVLIDGELVDTTPIGRAIPVSAGRHYVTFRHPNAPDEKRSVKVLAGQTVLLDVTMHIERPVLLDAGAAPVDSSP